MNKIVKILVICLIVIAIFGLVRDFALKSIIGSVVGGVIGAPVKIGGLSLSIIKQTVRIRNLRIYNPKGFPKDLLVDIPKIRVVWDIAAISKGKLHLKLAQIEIKELIMTKNKQGKLNVDSLKISEEKPDRDKGRKPAKVMPMRLDIVNLAMGRVVRKDYTKSETPVIKVYDINMRKSYKNITSVAQLAALIISEPLKSAGIQGLKMYAVSALSGVAALPVAAAFTFTGKDYAQTVLEMNMEYVYDAGLRALKQSGSILSQDKTAGIIKANVNGARVALKLEKVADQKTRVTVSARKLGLPRPEVASAVIYRITEEK